MAEKDDYLIDILVDLGYVTPDKVAELRPEAHSSGVGVVDLMLANKIVNQAAVTQAKAAHFGAEVVNLAEVKIPDDVIATVKLNLAGRLSLVNGDAQEILPGITVYTGGKHTYQSQYVGVNTRAGTVVLASDNMYLYENLEKHVPIAATLDAASNLRAQDRMKQLAATPALIIPGHDPAVMTKFPNPAPGVARIE